MAKLSNSAAVTDSTGLALPATEKNATIEGTLANQIAQLNTDLKTVTPTSLSNGIGIRCTSTIDNVSGWMWHNSGILQIMVL